MSKTVHHLKVTLKEVKSAYNAHTGALLEAFAGVLDSVVGCLMKQPLPSINFWRPAYVYFREHHVKHLPVYKCCGRTNRMAWKRVIEVYYLKQFRFRHNWKGTPFRDHKKHVIPCRWSAPMGTDVSIEGGYYNWDSEGEYDEE